MTSSTTLRPRARRPRIGLTTYFRAAAWGDWNRTAALVPATYLYGVQAAGGTPLLLPPVGTDTSVLDVLDALVIIGGGDMDPASYGAGPDPHTVPENPRDEAEIALVRAAIERRMPVLAICRGAQVLNVAYGGTLEQHLPDRLGHHEYRPSPGVFGRVGFSCEPGSRVAAALGPQAWSPCYHHQGIAEVADGLQVTARSAEGLVQALEPEPSLADSWVLGVQFHPEENPDDSRLFRALIDAAAGSNQERTA